MRSYDYNSRLNELARNILFGMEIVDKRVDTRPKNIKRELNEEETKQAMLEQEKFFGDKRIQEKLERLKFLITDDSNQKKIQKIWEGKLATTPQSEFDRRNMSVGYDPYSEM